MALTGNGQAGRGRLRSWKEIGAFFGADARTVKRWENERGLPVRRIPGGAKASVYADVADLERWLADREASASPLPRTVEPKRKIWPFVALSVPVLVAGAAVLLGALRPAAAPPHHQPAQAVADLYFQGQYNLERRTPESLNRANSLFSQAVARDSDYAEAFAGLANCNLMQREYSGLAPNLAYERARTAARRALALDPNLADAHAALAFTTFYWDRNFAAGLEGFRRAIALAPGAAGVRHWYATALLHAGDFPAALDQINIAQRLDPESHAILSDKGIILFSIGRRAEAIALLGQIEIADPAYLSPHSYLTSMYLAQGNYRGYLAEERETARLLGDAGRASVQEASARGLATGGAPAMFRAMLARQRALHAQGRVNAYTLAATYALMGDRPAAMDALDNSVRNGDPEMLGIRIDMRFTALRDLPEFQRLVHSVGRA